ncbi:bifunctional enoyl-CoA hydratase/phosphate acetyltransferase [Piscinibacter sakaiensis]|uniref:Phosphate acetyltransferase n=1 Tax=Piscinibacter sakaiensis TaxID=1547922 RepID=A0A0K8P619_PISS1|nr:bifunctional enoyl-CoA hydratase/phosphate acetyltransferase [Piscinibacter sakaiensis]GAP37974.1 phosphate acetyltransferase [Piscinibacter sakaiensis]
MGHPRLDELVARARVAAGDAPPRLALVWPCDALAAEAAQAIADAGIARPVLFGPAARLGALAGRFEHVDTPDEPAAAARAAVLAAREGRVAALMKGSLHTDELMSAVVARDTGLRGARRISHVFLFDLPRYPKLLALADCVVNIAPDLKTKQHILANALDLLRALGTAAPKVGIVTAVETVNPAIPATLDARELVALADAGEFGAAIVEGPFGFDNAYSAEAARIKGLSSRVAGDADLLLMPDLNAGNMLYKSFVYVAGGDCAGLVLGARVPIVLTSRADSAQARLASAALAVLTSTGGAG